MANQPQQQIQLPPVINFTLPAPHAIVILEALGSFGPYKTVHPVLANFEQQLLAQQVRSEYAGPPPGAVPLAEGLVDQTKLLDYDCPPSNDGHAFTGDLGL